MNVYPDFNQEPRNDHSESVTRDRRPFRGERTRPGETRIRRMDKQRPKYRFDHRFLPDDEDF